MTSTARRLFAVLAVIGLVSILPHYASANDGSRMAAIESLVERHTWVIDDTGFDTIDRVFIDGHFYSDKLATVTLLGAAAYWPLHAVGVRLGTGWSLGYFLITLLVVKSLWLLGILAFYRTLRLTRLEEAGRLWLTAALGFGSLYFTWSATFNSHEVAASLIAIGFWLLVTEAHVDTGPRPGRLLAAGTCLGLAASCDPTLLAATAAFLGYVVSDARLRSTWWAFVIGSIVALLPAFWVNVLISGSPIPVQLVPAYFDYPGSPWSADLQLTGEAVNRGWPLVTYAAGMLLGSRGFLLYNPLLLLALPLLAREAFGGRQFTREARAVVVSSLAVVAYYVLFSVNYGGWSYSIRWFVPLLPLWLFFLHPFLVGWGRRRQVVFGGLLAVSVVIAAIGVLNPWSALDGTQQPILANLYQAREFAARLLE